MSADYAVFNATTHAQLSPAMNVWCAEQWEDDYHNRIGWDIPLEIQHI